MHSSALIAIASAVLATPSIAGFTKPSKICASIIPGIWTSPPPTTTSSITTTETSTITIPISTSFPVIIHTHPHSSSPSSSKFNPRSKSSGVTGQTPSYSETWITTPTSRANQTSESGGAASSMPYKNYTLTGVRTATTTFVGVTAPSTTVATSGVVSGVTSGAGAGVRTGAGWIGVVVGIAGILLGTDWM